MSSSLSLWMEGLTNYRLCYPQLSGMQSSRESCGRFQTSLKSLRTEVLALCWHGSSSRMAPVSRPLWQCSSPVKAAPSLAVTSSWSALDTDSPSSRRDLLQENTWRTTNQHYRETRECKRVCLHGLSENYSKHSGPCLTPFGGSLYIDV